MKYFKTTGNRLSENIVEENGFLKCYNVKIARTGPQEYHSSSLGEPGNEMWTVLRYPEDVFDESFMLSLDKKPFVVIHPPEDVTAENGSKYIQGILTDIRKGHDKDLSELGKEFEDSDGNNTIYGTVIVFGKAAVKFVKEGMKDVSLGYDAKYEDIDREKRIKKQIPILGNHIALVPRGRAGTAKIRDSLNNDQLHNCQYLSQELPYPYEGGFKKEGITKWEIKEMSADEYFEELVTGVKTHLEDEARPLTNERVNEMVTSMSKSMMINSSLNWKPTMPLLLYNTSSDGTNDQDGRHRVAALEQLGVTNIPVLIVHKTENPLKATNDSKTLDIAPSENEEEKEFVSRFMSNDEMVQEYPNEEKRTEVANYSWEKSKRTKDIIIIDTKDTIYEFKNIDEQEAFEIYAYIKNRRKD